MTTQEIVVFNNKDKAGLHISFCDKDLHLTTKYNIGDEVWVANVFEEPFKVKVYGVDVEVLGNRTFISYYVGLNEGSCSLRREYDVFPTKEELLKSL